MKPGANEKKEAFKAILADLRSDREGVVIDALQSLREKGNDATTRQVIRLLAGNPSLKIETEALNYLLDLKHDAAIEPLIEAIEDPDLKKYKAALISVFWQSSLDGSDHLMFFIDQVYNASYEEILEILTVIENFKGPFPEDDLFEAIARLNEFMEEEDQEEKIKLMSGMIEVLNQY